MAGEAGESSPEVDVEAAQTVQDLAEVLRWLRRRQARRRQDSPVTYRELAARTGWARGAIGDYFAGQALPPTDRFDVLIRLLGAAQHEQGPLATARDRVEENRRRVRPVAATGVPPLWELPGVVGDFVGRQPQLAELDELLADVDNSRRVVVSAVTGTAGVGKTALVVHWAHRSAGQFPDGCLYVDLRGYGPDPPVQPDDALVRLLGSLGQDGGRVPSDVAGLAGRYRSLLAGRRLLVVLDNARSAEQVRPLLPGGTGCFVVVTSRDALAGLVARDGAQRLYLDLLPMADALALLSRLVGERVDTEPDAARAMVEQCARLPLALRVAAELAVSRPAVPLSALVAELAVAQRRLDLLDAGGDAYTAVRAVFSWSYQALSARAAHAFRLFGVHPGPDLDTYALAALAGADLVAAQTLLDELVRAHLVQPGGPGRYRMHDLLRGYATDLATAELGGVERRAALTRLFDHYLHSASAAMDTLYPRDAHRRPQVPPTGADLPAVRSAAPALAWLEVERANLVSTVRYAAGHGWPGHAWRLAQTVWRHLDAGGHHTTSLAMHGHAYDAAHLRGDGDGVVAALLGLGAACVRLGRYQEAMEHYQLAHDTADGLGSRAEMARALNNLGNVCWRLGRYADALDRCEAAIAIYRDLGDFASVAGSLTNVGLVLQQVGRHAEALEHHRRALAVARDIGDRLGEVHALVNMGVALAGLGDHAEALSDLGRALDLARELGDRTGVALALVNLGTAHRGLGAHAAAVEHLEQALVVSREIGDRDTETDALNTMGATQLAMGRHDAALTSHEAALAMAREYDDRLEQARALDGMAHALTAAGRLDVANGCWRRALAIYSELGVPEADEVRARLPAAASGQGR